MIQQFVVPLTNHGSEMIPRVKIVLFLEEMAKYSQLVSHVHSHFLRSFDKVAFYEHEAATARK